MWKGGTKCEEEKEMTGIGHGDDGETGLCTAGWVCDASPGIQKKLNREKVQPRQRKRESRRFREVTLRRQMNAEESL